MLTFISSVWNVAERVVSEWFTKKRFVYSKSQAVSWHGGVISGITAYLSSVSPLPDVCRAPSDDSLSFPIAPRALPKVHSEVVRCTCCKRVHVHVRTHTHMRMHKYMLLEYGWTVFDSFLTSSRWRCQGQLLLPHLCSAVRAQSSLWTAYYPDTASGESNQLQRCTALAPDGVGDESSHYISAG